MQRLVQELCNCPSQTLDSTRPIHWPMMIAQLGGVLTSMKAIELWIVQIRRSSAQLHFLGRRYPVVTVVLLSIGLLKADQPIIGRAKHARATLLASASADTFVSSSQTCELIDSSCLPRVAPACSCLCSVCLCFASCLSGSSFKQFLQSLTFGHDFNRAIDCGSRRVKKGRVAFCCAFCIPMSFALY